MSVVAPGTDGADLAIGTLENEPERGLRLLCVASLTTRKGHDTLFASLETLRDHRWELVCAGSAQHDPQHARALRGQIDTLGMGSLVSLVGELDDEGLRHAYSRADVFVLASHHEGYGMVFDEALARGLPIVSTTAGAIPDTVPPAAGLLVEPGDALALAGALRRVMVDSRVRQRLREGAIEARETLRSWTLVGEEFDAVLRIVCSQSAEGSSR